MTPGYVRAPVERARRPEIDAAHSDVARLLDRTLRDREISNLDIQRATGIDEKEVRKLRSGEHRLSLAAAIVLDRHFRLGLVAHATHSARLNLGG